MCVHSRAAPPPRRATKRSLTSLPPARSDRIPTQCTQLPRWSPASLLEITQLSSCSLASDTCHYARRNHARLSLTHYSCPQSRRSLPATSLVCQARVSSRRHPPRDSHHSSPDSAPPTEPTAPHNPTTSSPGVAHISRVDSEAITMSKVVRSVKVHGVPPASKTPID
jgi:hypothetical protein